MHNINSPYIFSDLSLMFGRSQGERENFLLSDLSPSYRVLGLDTTSLQVLMALYHCNWPLLILVKFIYSEKAAKFCEIFPLLLTVTKYIGQK